MRTTIIHTKIINLYAGPGSGKSTTRADLFATMKKAGMIVEETTEYAKDLTWDNNSEVLSDQLYVLAKQNRKLERLRGKVEWVITDSPLLLSINYARADYLPENFRNLVFELSSKYHNMNFFIKRVKPYSPIGRNQTFQEALDLDKQILDMLEKNNVVHTHVLGNENCARTIMSILTGKPHHYVDKGTHYS